MTENISRLVLSILRYLFRITILLPACFVVPYAHAWVYYLLLRHLPTHLYLNPAAFETEKKEML